MVILSTIGRKFSVEGGNTVVRHIVGEKNHEPGNCQREGILAISVVLEAVLEGYKIFLEVTI